MTFKTPNNKNPDQNALDYQFVIANDDDMIKEVRTFVRVDTEYGIRGFNLPGCKSIIERTAGLTSGYEIFDDSSTVALGQRVSPNYFRCSKYFPESKDSVSFVSSVNLKVDFLLSVRQKERE